MFITIYQLGKLEIAYYRSHFGSSNNSLAHSLCRQGPVLRGHVVIIRIVRYVFVFYWVLSSCVSQMTMRVEL